MNDQPKLSSKFMRRWESQSIAKHIYNASPWYIQNIFISAYGLILMQRLTSPAVKQYLAYYLKTQWLSKAELAELQKTKLRALIHHAYHNVPYYRQVFDDLHLKPEDIREVADLQKLPLLSKREVRQNFDRLFASNFDRRKMNAMATSGTTGSPLTVYVTSHNAVTERALNLRMRNWGGWNANEKRATLSGYSVIPQGPQNLPLWRHDWPERRLFLSPYHMTSENMGDYIEKLRDFQPTIIESYPSYLSFLALYLERKNDFLPVQSVFTASETLFPYQRQIIEERFKTKIFDWYGLTERAASAAQCKYSDGYHVNGEKSLVEIVRSDGSVAPPGEYGEIVGTNLEEYGMPLIRYRSGDMSALRSAECPCGRNLPLIEQIQTRVDDIITTSDGRLINPAPLAGLFRSKTIERGRIIQEDSNRFTVQIVAGDGYSEADAEPIIKGVHRVVGSDAEVSVQVVDEISSLPNGKYPFVISKIRTNP
jgi:phenylacetate-CoA ligase